jgi:hypothetical protein
VLKIFTNCTDALHLQEQNNVDCLTGPEICLVALPSWSYCSWIYNYLYNQCLLPLKLWVRTPFMARCTRYNIIYKVCQWSWILILKVAIDATGTRVLIFFSLVLYGLIVISPCDLRQVGGFLRFPPPIKCIEYTSPWTGFELTTLVVTSTDCIGSCKSNYNTTMTARQPNIFLDQLDSQHYFALVLLSVKTDWSFHIYHWLLVSSSSLRSTPFGIQH